MKTILHITDTHLLGDAGALYRGFDTETSLARVVARAAQQHPPPDLVLVSGDITQNGEIAAYRRLVDHLQVFSGIPVCLLPGNHDDVTIMTESYGQQPGFVLQPVSLGDWRIVPLDSTLAGNIGGSLADEQLLLLERELQQYASNHVLVSLHHQPVPMGSKWIDALGMDNSEQFNAIICRHANVRVVVWGHVHQEYDNYIDGVRYLASPSTCMQFLPGAARYTQDPDAAAGYRILQLHDDGRVQTSVHRLS